MPEATETTMPTRASNRRGVLYIAFGERFREECRRSVASLQALHPELPVCIVTDEPWPDSHGPEIVLQRESIPGLRAKPYYIRESPFEETLFLDTDTTVVRPILDVFDLLDDFDIGIQFRSQFLRGSSPALPWCNSGVFVYRNNDAMRAVFEEWLRMFDEAQAASAGAFVLSDRFLPVAIANSGVRVMHLCPALNFFLNAPQITYSPIRIIHSRKEDEIATARKMNDGWDAESDWNARVWMPQLKGFFPSGGLRPPGLWIKDPWLALWILLRRLVAAVRG